MADLYAVPGETLTGIADAIRSKTGSDDFMTVASMAAAIEGISGGGGLEYIGDTTTDLTSNYGTLLLPELATTGHHRYVFIPKSNLDLSNTALNPMWMIYSVQNPRPDGMGPVYRYVLSIVSNGGFLRSLNGTSPVKNIVGNDTQYHFSNNPIYSVYEIIV